jgi:hypothetical protein
MPLLTAVVADISDQQVRANCGLNRCNICTEQPAIDGVRVQLLQMRRMLEQLATICPRRTRAQVITPAICNLLIHVSFFN